MLVGVSQERRKLVFVIPEDEVVTLAVGSPSIVLINETLVIMLLPKLFCTMTVTPSTLE